MNTGSTWSHPIHPMIEHLPISAWSLSFIFDLIALFSADPTLGEFSARVSYGGLIAGLAIALPMILTGLVELIERPSGRAKVRLMAWAHLGVSLMLTTGYATLALVREPAMTSLEMAFANGVLFCLLGLTGFLGGQLVYHTRIGSTGKK